MSMVPNFRARNYEDNLLEEGMVTLEQRRERGDHMFKDAVPLSTLSDREVGANTRAATGYLNVEPLPLEALM